MEESKFDASLLSLDYCNMDGTVLCQLSRDTMIGMFGLLFGERLYQSLEVLKAKHGKNVTLGPGLRTSYI